MPTAGRLVKADRNDTLTSVTSLRTVGRPWRNAGITSFI